MNNMSACAKKVIMRATIVIGKIKHEQCLGVVVSCKLTWITQSQIIKYDDKLHCFFTFEQNNNSLYYPDVILVGHLICIIITVLDLRSFMFRKSYSLLDPVDVFVFS